MSIDSVDSSANKYSGNNNNQTIFERQEIMAKVCEPQGWADNVISEQ